MNGIEYAVRSMKAAGAELGEHRPEGKKPGRARCTPNKATRADAARRASDPAREEPDALQMVVDRRCSAAAILNFSDADAVGPTG
jgi:hypothetical protein